MKTIEERADAYVGHNYEIDGFIKRMAYIAGATEQKEIDDKSLHERFEKVLNGQKWEVIDRACDWLKARNVLTEDSLQGFKKAMEE